MNIPEIWRLLEKLARPPRAEKHSTQEQKVSIFSFLKDVGEKIFGGGEAKADELKKHLDAQGLDTKDLQVHVEGDQVVLKGSVKDQATSPSLWRAIFIYRFFGGLVGGPPTPVHSVRPGARLG